ncbi:Zinc finger CW-type PWWP domain protein 1 [Galemys pyrenaicus]|uniref:Zinc finger CW-type PWWP domain protein 1 n=1 Tax=Galemys pyrenaicus TaxID=202257 RepID=A0A8J6DWW2_GALPY|nr:Zinc finger CW-type PWWP domain protein 1 [Galemys pyrenaicus]
MKTFAPPGQKLHDLMSYSSNSPQEGTLGINSPEAGARPNLSKACLEKKEEKTTTKNGPSSGQEKKGKTQDSKQAKKKEKEKSSLTNAEFEEIVQIVLQKSLQECLGMRSSVDFAETSCAQPIGYTHLAKEPEIAASTTDNDNADGVGVKVPHILEISASHKNGVIPEIKTSIAGQPDPAPSEKKFSRSSLSKRKKETQDEKMEEAQSGHEQRQNDQSETTDQGHSQIRSQQNGEGCGFGQCLVWVQCSSPNCEKWRRLRGNIDPSVLPDNWSCDQNTDLEHNRCDIPEEIWTGRESDVAYASYIPGSIIWAKQYGYPWWPGMVESDPDLGEYFLFASHLDSLPSKYHVTFFGETVSRAWIPVNMLKNFQELSLELAGVKKCRNKDCSQKLGAALMMAQEAEQINIQERVNLFGFWSRYNGSDNNGERKDVMISGSNSPSPSLEKEEEESELDKEEKEEENKDPPLPSPKSTKIQTKKLKARGPKKKFKAPQSKASETSLSEKKEARIVPKGETPSAHCGTCSVVGQEGPGPQELQPQEDGGVLPDDEASSDLDLDQLMEEVDSEPEQREELQQRGGAEEFPTAFFEE